MDQAAYAYSRLEDTNQGQQNHGWMGQTLFWKFCEFNRALSQS